MNVTGSLDVLEKQLLYRDEPIILHSDKGLQYCSNKYQKILDKNNILPSITIWFLLKLNYRENKWNF